jgi:hypothetical protein
MKNFFVKLKHKPLWYFLKYNLPITDNIQELNFCDLTEKYLERFDEIIEKTNVLTVYHNEMEKLPNDIHEPNLILNVCWYRGGNFPKNWNIKEIIFEYVVNYPLVPNDFYVKTIEINRSSSKKINDLLNSNN